MRFQLWIETAAFVPAAGEAAGPPGGSVCGLKHASCVREGQSPCAKARSEKNVRGGPGLSLVVILILATPSLNRVLSRGEARFLRAGGAKPLRKSAEREKMEAGVGFEPTTSRL